MKINQNQKSIESVQFQIFARDLNPFHMLLIGGVYYSVQSVDDCRNHVNVHFDDRYWMSIPKFDSVDVIPNTLT